MKKIFVATFLLAMNFAFSQVIIGDATGTATTKTGVLLEFSKTQNKGMVFPYITTMPTTVTEGSIILDATNAADARLKYYNGSWVDLSTISGDAASALALQSNTVENSNAKTIIGAGSSTAKGILVLESTTKAMVLPQVSDVASIVSPAPGMMVYVNKDGAKRLAVYNGSYWTFWKP